MFTRHKNILSVATTFPLLLTMIFLLSAGSVLPAPAPPVVIVNHALQREWLKNGLK